MPDGGYLTEGECLIMDRAAKLVQDSMVAVFLDGNFATVGRIVRRPVPSRHLVIEWRDVLGAKCISRMWGLNTSTCKFGGLWVSTNPCRSEVPRRTTKPSDKNCGKGSEQEPFVACGGGD